MTELGRRQDEVRATFANEGVRHEQAFLLESAAGPVLVYAIEVEDVEAAQQAYEASTLAIDAEHRQVMAAVLGPAAEVELLYEARL
jgi:hypothetical protein